MKVSKEIIEENVERVKKGLPLTMPLAILNGKMQSAWYREANKDKIAKIMKAYREVNKDKIAKIMKAYYEANKDKKNAYFKAYYKANKERIAKRKKAYYEANKERLKAVGNKTSVAGGDKGEENGK